MKRLPNPIYLGLALVFLLTEPAAATQPSPTPSVIPAPDLEGRLQQVPLLPELSPFVWEIFAQGQEQGNLPHVFAKAGDSNSDSPQFLAQIDRGNYNLAPYDYLQDTVDFFTGSFSRKNQSTNGGFNVAVLQDTLLADPRYCEPGETPLTCELRRSKPSLLFYTLGSNDLMDLKHERFEAMLISLVETCIQHGVIPVLMTYSLRRDSDMWRRNIEFNIIMVEIAQRYDIPLINYWLGAQSLPANGITDDTIHFSYGNQGVYFGNGEASKWGHDLRNLLTLLLLDAYQHGVLTRS